MSHKSSPTESGHSVTRLLKEVFLSLFVLFFNVSRWKGRLKASSASLLVSAIFGFLILAFLIWIQAVLRQHIVVNRWIIVMCFVLVAGPSDYFLVVRGYGVGFEKKFRSFSRGKRLSLYSAALGIILATGIAVYLSVAAYHQTFGVQ